MRSTAFGEGRFFFRGRGRARGGGIPNGPACCCHLFQVMATESTYDAATRERLAAEAAFIAAHLKKELTKDVEVGGQKVAAALYANKRYAIPAHLGGWVAYPIPSRASTSWGIFWDQDYNPFHLLGNFTSTYDM